jgi:predicted RNA-binding protein Jag
MEYRKKQHPSRESQENFGKIDQIIIEAQRRLRDNIEPYDIADLNAFERKRIHSFFDNKPEYKTKTYRDEENYIFRIYPIGNLKNFVEKKAQEALETGVNVALPPMSSYERFIVHDHLKTWDGIETISVGEDSERHIELKPKRFGRTLKRIIKKMKLF